MRLSDDYLDKKCESCITFIYCSANEGYFEFDNGNKKHWNTDEMYCCYYCPECGHKIGN